MMIGLQKDGKEWKTKHSHQVTWTASKTLMRKLDIDERTDTLDNI
jgi:hypothetical protein